MKVFLKKAGFTLIELIIVIAVLAVLAAIAIPSVSQYIEHSRITIDQTTIRTLNTATQSFKIENKNNDSFIDASNTTGILLTLLANDQLIPHSLQPKSSGEFVWLFDQQRWYLLFEDSFYVISASDGIIITTSGHFLGRISGSYTGPSKDIVIPKSLDNITITSIGQDAFSGKDLISVSFDNESQINQIHARAFFNNNISSIVFPDTLTRIDVRAFMNNNITEIKLPSNLSRIETDAFTGNPIEKITIGEHVDTIQNNALGINTIKFKQAYELNGAGTYLWNGSDWIKQSE